MSERFLGGYSAEWYDSVIKSRDLIYQYNNSHPSELLKRYEILKELLGKCDEKTLIEPPFHCDDGKNIYVGEHFYANYNLTVLDYVDIRIGNDVLIGPNVVLTTATHSNDYRLRNEDEVSDIMGEPIVIEDNVWIGANCTILPGVHIGKHSIVAAGSVVTKSVPDDVVVGGVPAKIIKKLEFPELKK